jgi:phage shock protein C
MNDKKLYRDDRNATIGGVCKGLADYFEIDVTIVRVLFLLALVLKGGGVLIYIVLMVVMPKKPWGFGTPGVDYTMPPQGQPADPFIYQPAPRRKSNFSLVAGLVLIFLGGILLLDEYDIIPDWDFEHLWPVPLVVIGIVLLFTGKKDKPLDPQPPIE